MMKPTRAFHAAGLLLCILHCSDAGAEQFSYQCVHSKVRETFTFDDQTRHVIGYGIGVLGPIVDAIFIGNITAISPDEIQFDLVLTGDNVKLGSFTLNRKEQWMSSLEYPGRTDLKDPCQAIPIRPVLDLWRLIDQNP